MATIMKLRSIMRMRSFSNQMTRNLASISLSGVFPPIPTPFDENEEIDFKRLEHNFNIWNQHKLSGYVTIGSNGESASLRWQEKVQLVRACHRLKRQDALLIAGAGCETTRDTAALCCDLAAAGADALLVLNPSFFRAHISESALHDHFLQVADASPKPIIVYNMPANTGYDMSVSLMSRLSQHSNIVGVKDSSGDVVKLAALVDSVQRGFQVLAGTGSILQPGLQLGANGGICAIANVLPEATIEVFQLHVSGNYEAAAQLQKRLIGPNAIVTRGMGVPALKAAMQMFGFDAGVCRRPLQPLSEDRLQLVRHEFVQNHFL